MTADDDLYWYDDATYQQGIHFYYPRTKEIKYAFKMCLWYCGLLTFLLPCFVAIHQRLDHWRTRRRQKEENEAIKEIHNDHNDNNETTMNGPAVAQTTTTTTTAGFFDEMLPYYEMNMSYIPQLASSAESSMSGLQYSTTISQEQEQQQGSMNFVAKTDYVTMADGDENSHKRDSYVNHAMTTKTSFVSEHISRMASKQEINLLYGPRPWYCFYCSPRFWRKICKCARFDDEMEKILGLALPYTINIIIKNAVHLLESGVIGRLLGTANLTAYYTVDFGISFATMFLHGILSSLTVLVSHAVGAQNHTLVGIYVQLCVLTYQLLFLPILIFGWNRFGYIAVWLGFDGDIAGAAQEYGRFALICEGLSIYNNALHYVLGVTGHENYSAVINGMHSVSSFITVLCVSMFHRGTKLSTIGAIHLGMMILFSVANVAIILFMGWFDVYWRGMIGTNPFRAWRPVRTFIKAAILLSCSYVIEYCEWDILFIFAALQGPAGKLLVPPPQISDRLLHCNTNTYRNNPQRWLCGVCLGKFGKLLMILFWPCLPPLKFE
jgi:hypothetical protein